jgi:hypothetical protein
MSTKDPAYDTIKTSGDDFTKLFTKRFYFCKYERSGAITFDS